MFLRATRIPRVNCFVGHRYFLPWHRNREQRMLFKITKSPRNAKTECSPNCLVVPV
jgi:hypothetical protein